MAAARKLHLRKERVAAGAFLVEGPHAVAELLAGEGWRPLELFLTEDARDREPAIFAAAADRGVATVIVTPAVVDAIAETKTPQGVVAVVARPDLEVRVLVDARPRLVAALCGVADPGNAGTVIRTADAAGADAVILTTGSADPYAGKAVRASAGSLFHVPVYADVDGGAIAELRTAGVQVVAADMAGTDLDDVPDEVLARPTVWLFGNEAHGLADEFRELADVTLRVPIHGAAESLNLASAAAVCLYASARVQRRFPRPTT